MGAALCVGLALLVAGGCAVSPERFAPALRVSSFSDYGGPARRAATRLVLQGLDADAQGRAGEALSRYERALQVDPENAFAYLALARHEAFSGTPERALSFLDKAEANLRALARAGALDWALATPHLTGLRAVALRRAGGRGAAWPHQSGSARAVPTTRAWADGVLDAFELR